MARADAHPLGTCGRRVHGMARGAAVILSCDIYSRWGPARPAGPPEPGRLTRFAVRLGEDHDGYGREAVWWPGIPRRSWVVFWPGLFLGRGWRGTCWSAWSVPGGRRRCSVHVMSGWAGWWR